MLHFKHPNWEICHGEVADYVFFHLELYLPLLQLRRLQLSLLSKKRHFFSAARTGRLFFLLFPHRLTHGFVDERKMVWYSLVEQIR